MTEDYVRREGPMNPDLLLEAAQKALRTTGYPQALVATKAIMVVEAVNENMDATVAVMSTPMPAWTMIGLLSAAAHQAGQELNEAVQPPQ